MESFRIYFNRRKQWLGIYIHDVHPNTFANWKGGRWGYFLPTWGSSRRGKFGELHLVKSRIREDTITHETFHVVCAWLFARNVQLTPKNEEKMAEFQDELVRKFYREYRKGR